MTDLADEAATLAINVDKLNAMHDALGTFNEAFAGYMYALKMNAFCVSWDEVGVFISIVRVSAPICLDLASGYGLDDQAVHQSGVSKRG